MGRSEKDLNAIVSHIIEVAPGLVVLRVVPDGWSLPEFIPGQFAVLGLPPDAPRCAASDAEEEQLKRGKLIRRAYSIASSSVASEYLEFYINLVQSGRLTPRLFALEPGDRVWLGPKISGTFTLDQAPTDRHVLLVATGTGLAPYMSMLRSSLPDPHGRRWAVLLGARHSWDLGYHDELLATRRLCPDFDYLPTISRPGEEIVPWCGRTGYVVELWRSGEVSRSLGFEPSPDNSRIFLCGNPGMIEDMLELLAESGFREHSRNRPGEVFVERYW
jgi:ferredoxin--NADP+ reductase